MESDFPYIVLICSKDCTACNVCPRDETLLLIVQSCPFVCL